MDVLLVEDDAIIASGLVYALRSEGWEVRSCESAEAALDALDKHEFAIALLDLSLPDGDGYEIFRAIRKKNSDTPVIFVTAVDDEGNTVKALEMGADDYIAKPFRLRELLARIKTVLRRAADKSKYINSSAGASAAGGEFGANGASSAIGNSIIIDPTKAKVTRNGEEIPLTAMEYRLLLTFAQYKGQTLSRKQILESLWDAAGSFVNDNTLTVYVKRLREKLENDPQNPQIIQTVRGLGYRAGE